MQCVSSLPLRASWKKLCFFSKHISFCITSKNLFWCTTKLKLEQSHFAAENYFMMPTRSNHNISLNWFPLFGISLLLKGKSQAVIIHSKGYLLDIFLLSIPNTVFCHLYRGFFYSLQSIWADIIPFLSKHLDVFLLGAIFLVTLGKILFVVELWTLSL